VKEPDLSTADGQKRAAGEAATLLVEDGMTLGLGTASTAAFFVRALARRVQAEGLSVRGVATSRETEVLASELGLTLIDLDEAGEIDLTVDGVDEIDPRLVAIKGGGGALLREKLVWTASRRCVAIAHASKRVDRLGAVPLPIEVVQFGHATTAQRLTDLTGGMELRLRMEGTAALVTDEGHFIYDLVGWRGEAEQLAEVMAAVKALTGVVEHGLFNRHAHAAGLADEAVIATATGVEHLYATFEAPRIGEARLQPFLPTDGEE